MKNRAAILLFGAIFATVAVGATDSIQGVVRANGKPMKDAEVRLESKVRGAQTLTTRTDGSGKYLFSNLAPGAYRVTVMEGSEIKGSMDNVRPNGASHRIEFDIRQSQAGKATVKAKHLVYVPPQTGSHIGGGWVDVGDEGSNAVGSERVEKRSGAALQNVRDNSGNISQSGGH